MKIPGISLSDEDGQIYLRGMPDATREPVTAEAVRALLAHEGFDQCAVDEEALASVLTQCNGSNAPFVTPLATRVDAQIQVTIADDGMSAFLTITPAQGGVAPGFEKLHDALHQAHVVYGIDEAALAQAIAAEPDTATVAPLLVASGLPAVDGTHAQFVELLAATVDRAPRLNEEGLIDYREHAAIDVVAAGTELMRRIPATPGKDGFNVRGEVIDPVPGRDDPFDTNLQGAQVSATDPDLLAASRAGMPVRVRCGINVEPVLRVKEVNLATGNLHFDGTVQVDGEVNPGMKIDATGDIVVGGTVDGASLRAGGNIHVGGGIISHAQLHAAGSVSARFAEAAVIEAHDGIFLDDMAMDCELRSMNSVHVGIKSTQRGKLVGGMCMAAMLVKAPTLGSNKGNITKVTVGSNPELEARYRELQERIDKEATNEDNLKRLVHTITKQGDPKGMLGRAQTAWRQAVQVWGKSLAERGELDKELAQSRNARIETSLGTSGEIDMTLGTRKLRTRKEFGPGKFSVDTKSDLVFTDPSGQAIKLA